MYHWDLSDSDITRHLSNISLSFIWFIYHWLWSDSYIIGLYLIQISRGINLFKYHLILSIITVLFNSNITEYYPIQISQGIFRKRYHCAFFKISLSIIYNRISYNIFILNTMELYLIKISLGYILLRYQWVLSNLDITRHCPIKFSNGFIGFRYQWVLSVC